MTSFLLVSLLLFILWLCLFLFSNETRKEQLIMSVVGLILSPGILLLSAYDARLTLLQERPVIGVEDFLFAFSFFGIASVLYHFLTSKQDHKLRSNKNQPLSFAFWFGHLILVLSIWACLSLLLMYVFALTSVMALIITGLLIGMYVIAHRRDLIWNAILSGMFMAGLIFLIKLIFILRLSPADTERLWSFSSTAPSLFGGAGLEEFVWAGVIGFTIGPLYEWLRGYKHA